MMNLSLMFPLIVGLLCVLLGMMWLKLRAANTNSDNLAKSIRWRENIHTQLTADTQKLLWCFYGFVEATCAPRGLEATYAAVAYRSAFLLVSRSQDVQHTIISRGIKTAEDRREVWAQDSVVHAQLDSIIIEMKDQVLTSLWAEQSCESMMQIARYAYAKAHGLTYTFAESPVPAMGQ